ncbi:GNAT family N-acetyltransferase [Streptomyces agglomeratus]|uniref:GNAT family N-acetyltransferase n=1 Tax=Streptomyces agglomeratus TaxID=285458 RepID=A0A1E5PAV3_9ACTN|nr:GNAT family N-acetyltransferase [Streptomyces agglomeratus]OEJ26625.1 GNAT family N-acetyltransferase [Streptomyces agglomeratus]OEJ39307.1 GNAT family N-acetyltransferase [Streptomyces agglomeratus]OEJ46310.1 GNAT family N-acetyltransferase [Streptomyces agglomeratus]OEJ51827.1 GNAT family N-acetyltransferase [Streptomyces agglomeratus]OEJ59234.1 GNAT family N-acetyltransferase [Streptomyces agglomeratus]
MEPIILTTERLLLRPFEPADTEAVFQACQDPGIQRWTTVPSPYEREHAEGFVGRIVPDGWRLGSLYAFAVLTRDSGELAAAVSSIIRDEGVAEIGYWAAKPHRGRGYVTEAVRAVAHWAFTTVGVERLEWRAEVGNNASRAVAEKAGFVVEGIQRSGIVNKGVRRDSWTGALLPCDLGLPSAGPYLPARI